MTPEQVTDAVCDRVAQRVRLSAGEYIESVASGIRQDIGIPVTRSGSKVIRSKPGEPPRKEFGDYQASWQTRVAQDGDRITATAGTTSNIGPFLEFGTGRMAARPHAAKAAAKARAEAAQQIKSNL